MKSLDRPLAGSLQGKVAVVTGASRGAGRGIALALAEAGATVYVTGRSVRGEATTENLPGTIDETAETVTARGGTGIAVRCDHTVDSDVELLFVRVQREQGRLDLLVNNAWGGYEQHDYRKFTAPFCEQPLRHWDGMFTAGVRAALIASRFAASLMLPQRHGLIRGRAIVALASDQKVLEKSGKVLAVGDLAEEYGFTDVDGRRIPAFRISDQE